MVQAMSLFNQLLQHFPSLEFAELVKKHSAERAAKGFGCRTQLVAMLFCQFAQADSLREICNGLACFWASWFISESVWRRINLLDHDDYLPSYVLITEARRSDVKMADAFPSTRLYHGDGSWLCALQAKHHDASDPALRFVALLQAALACGRAHVADRRGKAPDDAVLWGWKRKPIGRRWIPQGTRIGWVAGSDVFLEPEASYQAAQELAGADRLVGEQTLRHRLRERGLLASIDEGRKMAQVRRTLQDSVLHLKTCVLVESQAEGARTTSLPAPTRHSKPLVKRRIQS
jgi:hypothetical protein